jgi:hypothetical protein
MLPRHIDSSVVVIISQLLAAFGVNSAACWPASMMDA